MRLFLAEKPSLGRAIATVLGNQKKEDGFIRCGDDVVSWCFGHILEQCAPEEYDEKYRRWNVADLPIVPAHWKLKVSDSCQKQFGIIKKLIGDATVIVNAGDPDREGQLLIDEVLNFIGVSNAKPIKRILLNALDEKSVREALNNLRDNREFVGLRDSALARSRADWLIGMNFSRLATLKAREAGYQVKSVRVGRVMTPTAALVIRREEAIKNFKPVDYYQLTVRWKHPAGDLTTTWRPREDQPGLDSEGRLLEQSYAKTLTENLKGKIGQVTAVEQREGQAPQRLPYSLSSLQIEAGKKFGYSPQQVLDAQQALYEKRLTSYPRSDCEYLPTNQLADAGAILAHLANWSGELAKLAQGADTKIQSRAWNDKKISAHHAIIPTGVQANPADLDETQKNLYELVARAYLAQFYPPQKYLATKITVECVGENFTASGKVILENGWRYIYNEGKISDDENETESKLPNGVKQGDGVSLDNSEILSKQTQPPKRFTPASLVEAMKKVYMFVKDESLKPILKECSGIGTEATRADTIEKIQQSEFVKLEKKYLVPTDTGKMMLSLLSDSLTYPDITAQWEQKLDAISQGNMSLADFSRQQELFIRELLVEQQKKIVEPPKNRPTCPKCGKYLVRIYSKKNQKAYWKCEGNPPCDGFWNDKNGQPDFAPKTYGKKSTGTKRRSAK